MRQVNQWLSQAPDRQHATIAACSTGAASGANCAYAAVRHATTYKPNTAPNAAYGVSVCGVVCVVAILLHSNVLAHVEQMNAPVLFK